MIGVKKIWKKASGICRSASVAHSSSMNRLLWLSNLPGFRRTKLAEKIRSNVDYYPYRIIRQGKIVRQEKNGWVNYGMPDHFEVMEWLADYIDVNMPDSNKYAAIVAIGSKMNYDSHCIDYHIGFLDPDMAMAFKLRWGK